MDELDTQKEALFSSPHMTKSAVVKIRLLYSMDCPRQEWRKTTPDKQIHYDVDNRRNSLYLMNTEAIRLRKEPTQFVQTRYVAAVLDPRMKR